MKLKDKVTLVTGAGGGFGEGIAKRFAEEGAKVAVIDIRGDAAERVAGEIGSDAVAMTADVSVNTDIARVVADTKARFGRIDVVVNNAGITHRNQPLLEVDESTFDRIFAVNVKSIYYMIQAVVPLMRGQGGGVVLNIGSTAGIRPDLV